jgi:hypothetical protein
MVWTELASKAEESEGQSLFYCHYENSFESGGWVNIEGDTYLENADTFEKLELISVLGVPLAPFRHYFTKPGEHKKFVLLFPKIPTYWKRFHLVECAGPGSFRVRDISRNTTGVYQLKLN